MRFLSYSTIISGLRLTNGATTSKLNHFLTAPWFEEDRERACYRSERNRGKVFFGFIFFRFFVEIDRRKTLAFLDSSSPVLIRSILGELNPRFEF
jgi:hypothetical protein